MTVFPVLTPIVGGVAYPTAGEGVGAQAYAPYPAPPGYRWDFVTYNGELVTYNGEPVVALVVA